MARLFAPTHRSIPVRNPPGRALLWTTWSSAAALDETPLFPLQVPELPAKLRRAISVCLHRRLRWQRVTDVDGNQVPASGIEPLLSVDEVAGLLRISERGVYRLIGRQELISVKVGGRTLFEPAAVQTFITKCRRGAGGERRLSNDSTDQEAA